MQKLLSLVALSLGLIFAYSPDFFIDNLMVALPESWKISIKVLVSEPFAMPAMILPFLVGIGLWVSRAFFGKSRESYSLLWVIAMIPLFAFGYDSFARPYLYENFGWKCDDCEMRAFFRESIGNKDWIVNYELFNSSPRTLCQNWQKEDNVKLSDIQKYVTMVTNNIDWLQMQVNKKHLNDHITDKDLLFQAYKKMEKVSSFQIDHLGGCWDGSLTHYLDKVEKLMKVQLQLYDQLVKGAAA